MRIKVGIVIANFLIMWGGASIHYFTGLYCRKADQRQRFNNLLSANCNPGHRYFFLILLSPGCHSKVSLKTISSLHE